MSVTLTGPIAVAHAMLVTVDHLLARKTNYDDPGAATPQKETPPMKEQSTVETAESRPEWETLALRAARGHPRSQKEAAGSNPRTTARVQPRPSGAAHTG